MHIGTLAETSLALQSALGPDQLSWLLNDLARVNRAVTPWVIVSWHQPPVSSQALPLAHACFSPSLSYAGSPIVRGAYLL